MRSFYYVHKLVDRFRKVCAVYIYKTLTFGLSCRHGMRSEGGLVALELPIALYNFPWLNGYGTWQEIRGSYVQIP